MAERPSGRLVVLMYHGFTAARRNDDPENLFVPAPDFARQLDHLLDRGWEPLDLDGYLEAIAGRRTARRSFLITIDDGFDSVQQLAAPALAARGVPAILFVPSGLLGRTATWLEEPADEPILDPASLVRLAEETTIEIGGHGFVHDPMVDLDPDSLSRNSVAVRHQLETVLDREVRAFAYPYGAHDAESRAAIEQAGFHVAFSVFDDAGPFAVSRVDVNSTDTLLSFRLKLLPGYRRWWRLFRHLRPLRRTVRFLLTRGRRS